jgi:signal transduction histidine kinase
LRPATIEWEALAEIEAPISAEDLNLLVDNLLDNALKYTLEEGKVTLEVANVAFDIVLRVSDSGIGFDDEAADRLFERFYRTGATEGAWTSHREGGSGELQWNGDGLEFRPRGREYLGGVFPSPLESEVKGALSGTVQCCS